MKLTKRKGPQACDACGRNFNTERKINEEVYTDWKCPWCGFNNVAGQETYRYAMRIAAQRSADLRRKQT